MKKIFNILLITLIVLGVSVTACNAQTLGAEQFKTLVINQVKQDLKIYELDEVVVNISSIPVEKFQLPDGNVSVQVASNSQSASGMNPKEFKKVSILVDKKNAYTTFVSVEIKAYKNVIVAKETILRDKAVSPNAIEVKKMDITRNVGETFVMEDLDRGLLTKKMFYPGEVITKKFVVSRPDVIKDALVYVCFQTENNLVVTVDGIAMNQGNIGDTVQVKNKKLNRIYTGKVVGENKVLVQI